jgi:hypothetical protein
MTAVDELVTVGSEDWTVTAIEQVSLSDRRWVRRSVTLGCTALDTPRHRVESLPHREQRLRLPFGASRSHRPNHRRR